MHVMTQRAASCKLEAGRRRMPILALCNSQQPTQTLVWVVCKRQLLAYNVLNSGSDTFYSRLPQLSIPNCLLTEVIQFQRFANAECSNLDATSSRGLKNVCIFLPAYITNSVIYLHPTMHLIMHRVNIGFNIFFYYRCVCARN